MLLAMLTTGCATTSTADNEWNMKNVGKGIQLGAVGSNAGVFAPVIWGIGVMVEAIGSVSGSNSDSNKENEKVLSDP